MRILPAALALAAVITGWGVVVPAAAIPFVAPLAIAMAASVSAAAGGARYILEPPPPIRPPR